LEKKIRKIILVFAIDLFSLIKLLMGASCEFFPIGQATLGISFQKKDQLGHGK
jgi:hypothetical protein